MPKEQKRRPPVFVSAEETVDDILGVNEAPEIAPSPGIETVEPPLATVEDKAVANVFAPHQETSSGVCINGWRVLTEAQHDGSPYLVSSDLNDTGTRAFWRKTRVLSHFKWKIHGKWTESLTNRDVLPEPRYYKELE